MLDNGLRSGVDFKVTLEPGEYEFHSVFLGPLFYGRISGIRGTNLLCSPLETIALALLQEDNWFRDGNSKPADTCYESIDGLLIHLTAVEMFSSNHYGCQEGHFV